MVTFVRDSLNRTVNDLSLGSDIDSRNLRYVLYHSEAAAIFREDHPLVDPKLCNSTQNES